MTALPRAEKAIVDPHTPVTFEVEFVAASGRTQALITLGAVDIRQVGDNDLITVRSLAQANG